MGYEWDIPSGYVKIAMEKSTMLLMGKSTISMAMASIAMLNYQRVPHDGW